MSIKIERKETNENAWKFIITRRIVCQKKSSFFNSVTVQLIDMNKKFSKNVIAKEEHPFTRQAQVNLT